MIDAIVVAAVVVAVVLVVRARVRAGAKGGCSGCGSASVCAGSGTGPCPVAGDAVESMEEAARRYAPQIVSRLDGEYHALHFFGDDIRLLKKGRL